jgi:hypothetical protein
MQASSEVGSQQVLLIDRPTVVTERKLADALLQNSSAWCLCLCVSGDGTQAGRRPAAKLKCVVSVCVYLVCV